MDVDFTARAPEPPLDRHVELLWHYSDFMPDHTLEKLLPDGAVELIIDLTDFPKRLHDPVDLRLKRLYRNGWISGMRSDYLVIGGDPRSLIELFDRSVGLKPKAMHRVFRFINVLERIEGTQEVDWAAVALDCGYYDQAHFNREFRAFSGATPTDYLERGGDLMFYMLLDSLEEPLSGPADRVKDLQDSPVAAS